MIERITVSLPKHINDSVTSMATEKKISRSRLIAELVEAEQKRIVERELIEGYAALAEEHRRFAEAAVGTVNEVWPSYEKI
jgi:metal-responsive CopG/Arc/MetJ family transcriptional regulator